MSVPADPTIAGEGVKAADECTPLLGVPDTAGGKALDVVLESAVDNHSLATTSNTHEDEIEDDKPMPYVQVILLCFAGMVDSVAYFAIFPIIGDMLKQIGGVEQQSVSIWSGVIEALFSVVQMMVMIQYGKLADRIGRKPVLVWSLFGIIGCSAIFGLSRSLWQMILFRAIGGLFAGSTVTVRSMLSEVTTKKTQARAFSWYMFARNMGIFIGPLIGGSLASPNKTLGLDVPFFDDYPFALSMFAAAAFCLVATLLTLLFVKETLAAKVDATETAGASQTTASELWKVPGVPAIIFIYGHIGLLSLMYTAVSPVWEYQKIQDGGLSFEPPQIGVFVAIAGASQAAWMLLAFPFLHKRFGTGPILRGCTYVWPFFQAISPVLNEFRRAGKTYPSWDDAFWYTLPPVTFFGSGVAMAFACIQLALNDIAPSPSTLGILNAIALTVSSGTRAFAPILGTAILQLGVKLRWLDGHLVWIILVALAVALIISARFLPAQVEGRPETKVV